MGKVRLPAGESALTRLNRVRGLLKDLEAGKELSKRVVARELVEYKMLLQALWLWQLKK